MALGTQTYVGELIIEECCRCGMAFGIPKQFRQKCLDDHSISFYCPNGHPQHFVGKTEAQKLKQQLRNAKQQLEWEAKARRRASERADSAERSAAAYKGHFRRVKRRVAHGVCPCCNRHFDDLQRHMETKHPDYQENEEDDAAT